MKKILVFLLLAVAFTSCYKDYIVDFDYNAIYIPLQTDVRTFVVGEGMKFDFGVEIGGIRDNARDRIITYQIDNSLITPAILAKIKGGPAYMSSASAEVTTLLPLPANYYTLSNATQFVIKKGEHQGKVTVRPDSVSFLSDPATIIPNYALGIRIITADADSILENSRTEVIGVKFENMLFGNYWHGGSALVNRPAKSDTTFTYYTTIPVSEAKIWMLKTAGPNTLYATGYFDQVTGKNEMLLALNGTDITIGSVAGSTWPIAAEGTSEFNRAKLLQNRKIVLKYRYTNTVNGYTYHCTDTLTFRNRMRDGVNEWQDENPANY
ncbi:MAG: DUF1735 domain-containing protein [Bacteroidetes bacterium]|nr:DUF1735 domain-containing protein [Bacteroidota bacterium]MCL6102272.1 DUF1735 domain-containing protein [Bacteroidota bacterium]